ncbi:MAG: HipA N-terminal domain-containing protein [Flammeovirgaceae bacterium]|nr:HipA N-terminal domain-containing protein [Flammeovirgaceae bacterium]
MRKAKIFVHDQLAGILIEGEEGYSFHYDAAYLNNIESKAISLTMPLNDKPYQSKTLFPFFDGLIPEGWLLEIAEKNWKINERDRMGLLLVCCRDCIGAVSVIEEK